MKLWVVAAVSAAMLTAGCSPSTPETIAVNGIVYGSAASHRDVVKGMSCQYLDHKLSAGDRIVVRGPSNEILGTGKLTAGNMDNFPTCILQFDIGGVPAGKPGYILTVGEYQPLIVTESDLRQDVLTLSARGATDALTGRTREIELDAE